MSAKRTDFTSIRNSFSLTQEQFWSKVGVTQSNGSRYENGRKMPKPTLMLFNLIYVKRIDINNLTKEHLDIANYLRLEKPELFKALKNKYRNKPVHQAEQKRN